MHAQMARQLAPSPLDRTKRRRGQVNYAEAHAHTPGNAKARSKAKEGAQDPAPPRESSSSSDASGVDTGAGGSSEDEGTGLEPEGQVLTLRGSCEVSPRPTALAGRTAPTLPDSGATELAGRTCGINLCMQRARCCARPVLTALDLLVLPAVLPNA